jgi:predicted membrane protein
MSYSQGFRLSWGGLVLVALGLLFLADQLDWFEFGDLIGTWWPAIFIVIGLGQLVDRGGVRASGVVFILVGTLLLLDRFGVLPMSVWQLWPLLLVFFGLSMLFRGRTPAARSSEEDVVRASAVMGGVERAITSQAFRGGTLSAVMGGVELDLRQAKLAPGGAEVHANVVMGGVELRVPPEWDVKLEGVPVMGGIADERKNRGSRPPGTVAQELRIKSSVLMGGIEVKD